MLYLNRLVCIGVLGVFSIINCSISLAQEAPSPIQKEASQAASAEPVLIVDSETKSFRFVIDGREVACIDRAGLHVRENINYGGMVTDIGQESYDQRTQPPRLPRDAD